MKQKNQKIGTFSRTKDRSGDVGEQKHGEEWKNFSENDNTFLAAVTSSKDVHAMHKTSKEQKSEKNPRGFFKNFTSNCVCREFFSQKSSERAANSASLFRERE